MKLPGVSVGVAGVIAVGLMVAGCVKIDGGAVEISWVVRSRAGAAITDCGCADPAIATVRLVLARVAGGIPDGYRPCDGQAQCDFPCQRQTGSTAFDIQGTAPGETYEISVLGVDPNGDEIPNDLVTTPAPILRSVVPGQATDTEAFQLVAACRDVCQASDSELCARH